MKRVKSNSVFEEPVSRTEVRQMMADAVNQIIEKIDAWVGKVKTDFLIRIMKNIYGNEHPM